MLVQQDKSSTRVECVHCTRHCIDGITRPLKKGVVEVENVNGYGHARVGGRRREESIGNKYLKSGFAPTSCDVVRLEAYGV